MPEDKLNRVTQPGKDNFGYPYCHQGNFTDPGVRLGTLLQRVHQAAGPVRAPRRGLGSEVLRRQRASASNTRTPSSWPGTARGTSSAKIGGDVVVDQAQWRLAAVRSMEPFITGFIQNNNYVGRPVDVLPMTDGSMLVSDDFNGAVYRVSRGSARVAGK